LWLQSSSDSSSFLPLPPSLQPKTHSYFSLPLPPNFPLHATIDPSSLLLLLLLTLNSICVPKLLDWKFTSKEIERKHEKRRDRKS